MPLFSIDGKQVARLPRKRKAQFDQWRRRTSDADYQRALDGIRARCDGKEFVVTTFMPGKDWTHNEFQRLYAACGCNEEHAGW